MKPVVRPGAASGYGTELARLRRELGPKLAALDELAGDPSLRDVDEDMLAALHYSLHTAAERVLGLEPSLWSEDAHEELRVALAIARDETADVAEALEDHDRAAASGLVWEWRVALFGVRLALRQAGERVHSPPPEPPRPSLVPVTLLVLGVAAVLGGALADLWPVWAAGLAVVSVSAGLSRRLP